MDLVRAKGAQNRVLFIAYSYGQAKKLHRLAPEIMISMTIDELSDFSQVENLNIPSNKILAWTGNRQPNAQLFEKLEDQNIEVIFGTLGGRDSIDNQIAQSGNEARYARIAKQGVDILGTDRWVETADALKKAGIKITSPSCSK